MSDEIDRERLTHLRLAWDEGYARGVRDECSDLEPAENPYRLCHCGDRLCVCAHPEPPQCGCHCHCGQPVVYGYDGHPDHHRGMCTDCDPVRCDVDPTACKPPKGSPMNEFEVIVTHAGFSECVVIKADKFMLREPLMLFLDATGNQVAAVASDHLVSVSRMDAVRTSSGPQRAPDHG